jgi:hypothetical protein
MEYSLSKHAEIRMKQRGVINDDVYLLISHGDTVIPSKENCMSHSMTSHGLRSLIDMGVPVQIADRLKSLRVITAPDGTIVTVTKGTQRCHTSPFQHCQAKLHRIRTPRRRK